MVMSLKECLKCHRLLNESNFNKNKAKKDGLTIYCKDCIKDYYEQNKNKQHKIVKTKICSKCNRLLSVDKFSRRSASPDGLQPLCKSCQSIIDKQRVKKQKLNINITEKYCSFCGKTLNIDQFDKSSYNSDGYQSMCKTCRYNYKQKLINREKYIHKSGYKKCTKCNRLLPVSEFTNCSYSYDGLNSNCKDCSKEHYKQNRDIILEKCRQYRLINKDAINYKEKQKYKTNPQIRLNVIMSSNIYHSIKQNKNEQHWENLVDYTIDELKQYLESQFDENMNWNNYGSYWEIDHIIPKNLFQYNDYTDKGFKICWSLLNLRPLEKIANRSRPKDGSDIPENIKNIILGQKL